MNPRETFGECIARALRDHDRLHAARQSSSAIAHCLKHGRISDSTRSDLTHALAYEIERIEMLEMVMRARRGGKP